MQIRAGYEISYDCAHSRDRRPTTVRAECPRATATPRRFGSFGRRKIGGARRRRDDRLAEHHLRSDPLGLPTASDQSLRSASALRVLLTSLAVTAGALFPQLLRM